jgi:hypothetical protein
MTSRFIPLRLFALLLCVASTLAIADPAPFDLSGPKLEVKVTRGDVTLPIAQVPNLAAGDKLWIHPDFPPGQAAHYLLIAAFLRGSTNPPPENWFFKDETWDKKRESSGLTVTVPEGAQQVLLFLAPETSGDFKTLINAVRGRPGAFVRASQDLNQASLDRSRLETYLDAVRKISASDPGKLKDVSPLLARSLGIQLNKDCLEKDVEEQASCLVQKQDSLILNDGHSMSIVDALTSGPAGDLALQASYTPQMSFGYYSPYVASIIDIARILDSFHTAEYQYIPALASQHEGALELKLNAPPSFHNPKSVLVVALPAVEAAQPPPLHPVDEKQVFCAEKNMLVLPVVGAPLVFSTAYARDMILHLEAGNGEAGDKKVDLPLKADATKGGFVVDNKSLEGIDLGAGVKSSVSGLWGFKPFQGPTFQLQGAREQKWQIASADQNALVVGRDDTLHLQAGDASCVDSIQFKDSQGKELKADWKLVKPDQVEVKLPLKDAKPGSLTLVVKQAGLDKPEEVSLHTFATAGHLETFTLHAGDHEGQLKGSRLDEVASVSVDGTGGKAIQFEPGKLSSDQGSDVLLLDAKDDKGAAALTSGEQLKATVTLHDGRTIDVPATVDPARPKASLIGKNIEANAPGAVANIQLMDQDELPQNSKLTFSLKAQSPASFSRENKIEVATQNESYSTMLSMGDGTLTLQDAKTALATLNPAKAFGASAFGPLRFRLIDASGAKGDWQPLATLVRLPSLQDLKCPATPDQPCMLSGSDLFLVDSVAGDAQFSHPVQVPDGFPGNALPVPHPDGDGLYVKLRDDPSIVNQVTLTVQQLPAQKAQSASSSPPQHPDDVRPASSAAQDAPTPNTQTPATGEQAQPSDSAPPAAPATAPAPSATPPSPATATPQP